jgi:hypothetical protein
MALNRLQIRRDSLTAFQTAALTPLVAEPQYIVEEKRIRIGDSKGTHVSRQQLHTPLIEGSQFHALWNIRSYGTGKCIDVPVVNGAFANGEGALDPQYYVASAPIPNGALAEAGIAYISASGDFLPGSTDPAMVFAFEIGQLEGNKTTLRPRFGINESTTSAADNVETAGIEISAQTGFINCLGDYNKPVVWDLDAKVCFLGRNSISPFKTSLGDNPDPIVGSPISWTFRDPADFKNDVATGGDYTLVDDNANVRIYGTLTIQDPFEMFQSGGSLVAHDVLTGGNGTAAGSPGKAAPSSRPDRYASAFPRGSRRVYGGISYEAMGLVPADELKTVRDLVDSNVTELADKVDRLIDLITLHGTSKPGEGRFQYRWWRPRKTVVSFSFEEVVPHLLDNDQVLSLKVGGPMQSDTSQTYPDLEAGEGQVRAYVAPFLRVDAATSNPLHKFGVSNRRYDYQAGAIPNVEGFLATGRKVNGVDYVCRTSHSWNADFKYSSTVGDNNAVSNQDWDAWFYDMPNVLSVSLTEDNAGDDYAWNDTTKLLTIGENTETNWIDTAVGAPDSKFKVDEELAFTFLDDTIAGTGFVDAATDDFDLVLKNVTFTAGDPNGGGNIASTTRSGSTDPGSVSTIAADADGEWNCAWRRLADDKRDRMRIHHTTAFFFGGRPGVNDFRPF